MPQQKSPWEDLRRVTITMKSLTFAAFALIMSMALTTSGQVKSMAAANNHTSSKPSAPTPTNTTRVRSVGQDRKTEFNANPEVTSLRPTISTSEKSPLPAGSDRSKDRMKVGHSVLRPAMANTRTAPASNSAASTTPAFIPVSSSQIYRVGIRDVLDIQLPESSGRESTLFTVLEGGVLEYPLINGPLVVAGMTTQEIAALLRKQLKIFENPKVAVSVRDYASHSITITGFVAAPGTKMLRREAMPLYAILAEAQVLTEAATATITRRGNPPIVVDLRNANLSSTLVVSGDSIKVSGTPASPTEFFFVGGQITSPGQKPYHAGLTLTQAILASGGTKAGAAKVRVSRQGVGGLLTTDEYNLRKIQSGKAVDPALQKGDRIEVISTN
jgi:protein involved in polysaccharide export with SLBB domain